MQRPTRSYSGRRRWLGAFVLLLGLGIAGGHALAEADCGDVEPPKETKGKCPVGYKYSSKHKGCAKVSCGNGEVWSSGQHACIDGHSASLTDQDFYTEAVALADEGQYREALQMLANVKKQEQSRVLNMVGYATRKLGDVDKGLDYYQRALALDPNYLRAREYLGEGYLQKGDVAKAKEQLSEIADRCQASPCEEYGKLERAIVSYVTEGGSADW
jgi:tetratricopeptide (TPR) repeat protein